MLRLNDFFVIKRKRENKVRIVLFVVCIVAAAFLAGIPSAYAADPFEYLTPDQINVVPTGTSYGSAGAILSQAFTPTYGNIAAVKVRSRIGGSFPVGGYNATINIRSGGPLGPILGSATTLVPDPQSVGTELMVPFIFSPSVCVSPGQTYFIEWTTPAPTIMDWMGVDNVPNPGPYPGGNAWDGLAEYPTIDYCFITYANAGFPLIDRTEWANLDFIRRAENGTLHSATTSYGNPLANWLALRNPSGVTSIQAKVTVNAINTNQAYTRARIGGFFFSAGAGDYNAAIYIGDDLGSGLRAAYFVERCFGGTCVLFDDMQFGVIGPVNIGEPHTLSIVYNQSQNRFEFQLDGGAVIPVIPQLSSSGPPLYPWMVIGTNIFSPSAVMGPGDGGYIDAKFENVLINGISTAISDANGMIDYNTWSGSTLEFVREQKCDGVYGLALRGYGSFVNNGLNLLNGQSVEELQADLTVEQFINNPSPNPATPMAGLEGNYYNAGGGSGNPGDQTGDIKALVGIRLKGSQPVGFYNIVKCTAPNCNIYPAEYDRLYYYEEPLAIGPDLVGKPHKVSISYNQSLNKFLFAFDGRATMPAPSDFILPLPSRVGAPNVVRMGPLTRVAFFSGLSGEGYVSAQFANIATVVDADGDEVWDSVDNCPAVYNPIVASWKGINGGMYSNSQPDFDLDGYGDACDLCPQTYNVGGGSCPLPVGGGNTSTSGPLITVNLTYTGEGVAKYLVEPDCSNVVFNTDKPIPQKCRRIPPYILTVLEEATTPGYGSPAGDWKLIQPNTSWTISCNLQEIFDEAALIANSPVKITPMYTFFDTDRGLDPAGNCVGAAQGDVCVDTTQYKLFQGTIPAQEVTVATTAFKSVPIDVKPGTTPKTVNLGSQGNVPVAILSTADFNATAVNPYSVKMGAASVRVVGKKGTLQESISDVNGDGRLDMIVHFDTQALALTSNAVEVCISGETTGGIRFIGCNSITIVP